MNKHFQTVSLAGRIIDEEFKAIDPVFKSNTVFVHVLLGFKGENNVFVYTEIRNITFVALLGLYISKALVI